MTAQSGPGSGNVATPQRVAALQRRMVGVLALATILGGLGVGASLSAGALLIADITGNPALSGFGSTMNAVGAAIAGVPLARLAARRGRRIALATGNAIAVLGAVLVVVASALHVSALLFVGLGVLGVAVAVQLQSRFAATDLAVPQRRARDLSLVVWSITIGAVTGPNLIGPGELLGEALGLPGLSGIFFFTIAAQIAAGLVVWIGLRPDPLLEAQRLAALTDEPAARAGATPAERGQAAPTAPDEAAPAARASALPQYLAIAMVALAHAVMVGLMAMTPLHLTDHGGSITLVGLTISLHIAGMYALSPVFGMLTSRLGAIPVILSGFGVLALAALGTGFGGESVSVIQTALILLGIGWCMVTVAGAALVTELTPAADRPARQGQSDTTMNAAGALFGAASGALFAAGGFPLVSVVAGVLIVLGAATAVRLLALRRG
ncbi:MFS transporter [Leucobacter luti]|uniref:Putative MFS family arabinose efflux permease n=1 Tax=Leucobacter luti TaxID=340320 RepID=A0A4Q7U951_9MICO|nr:MFS transporter [Leucobacter luti]MBL3700884.1 MFS transporter [Leucobacter luti]RZT68898.1 putative MFS family arabinose efflux permease [Leucobacter luti]